MDVKFRPFIGDIDWPWVQGHIKLLRTGNTSGIMAYDIETSETVGAIIFDNWTENSVHIHIIAPNLAVLKHGLIEEACNFVFNECGRKIAIGVVASDNDKSLKIAEKVGFTEYLRIEDGVKDGVDIVYLGMKKEDCQFLTKLKEVA